MKKFFGLFLACILLASNIASVFAAVNDGKPSLDLDGSSELLSGCATVYDGGQLLLTNTGDPGDDALGYRLWYTLEDNLISSVSINGANLAVGEYYTVISTLPAGASVTLNFEVTMSANWNTGATSRIEFFAEPLNRLGHIAHVRVSIENTCDPTGVTGIQAEVGLACVNSAVAVAWRFENVDMMAPVISSYLAGSVSGGNFTPNPGPQDWAAPAVELGWMEIYTTTYALAQPVWPLQADVYTLARNSYTSEVYVDSVASYTWRTDPCTGKTHDWHFYLPVMFK